MKRVESVGCAFEREDNGNVCVEVDLARYDDVVYLTFTSEEWSAIVAGVNEEED